MLIYEAFIEIRIVCLNLIKRKIYTKDIIEK